MENEAHLAVRDGVVTEVSSRTRPWMEELSVLILRIAILRGSELGY